MKEERLKREINKVDLDHKILIDKLNAKHKRLCSKVYRIEGSRSISDVNKTFIESINIASEYIPYFMLYQFNFIFYMLLKNISTYPSDQKLVALGATMLATLVADSAALYANDVTKSKIHNISNKLKLISMEINQKRKSNINNKIERLNLLKDEIESYKGIIDNATLCNYDQLEEELILTKKELSKRGKR